MDMNHDRLRDTRPLYICITISTPRRVPNICLIKTSLSTHRSVSWLCAIPIMLIVSFICLPKLHHQAHQALHDNRPEFRNTRLPKHNLEQ